ncbi:hypothetical protein ACO2Q1_11410 [Brevundimonas sp. VNH65]|uniref:hypothetical protein n=1 Tax=Brevundimonas sp. VNH65 TaxID=3400917 RepID=UPI003C129995
MLASLLTALALQVAPAASAPPPTPAAQSEQEAVDLGEVTVEGRRLEDMTRDFVREIAAPARNRGIARWRDGVCVGVANLQNDLAQYIVDRVSTVAEDVGLRPGVPGCTPSVLIVAVADANAFTPRFVDKRPRLFRVGGAGMDRGRAALEQFKQNDLPVRWWIVSAPVDDDSRTIAVRLFGEEAPFISRRGVSSLNTQIVDDTKRAFIIVDVDKLGDVSTEQLADYLAFVTLAQIDPEADTSGYRSILNVFDDPEATPTLTDWDKAYLTGLYQAIRTRRNPAASSMEVVSSIVRARRAMDRAEPDVTD